MSKSNLTFCPLEKPIRFWTSDSSQVVETVNWKSRPFLQIIQDTEFTEDNPYRSPEVHQYFIRSQQEDQLRAFYGYAGSISAARILCEDAAVKFEKFLNEWHNTKRVKP